VWLAKTALKVLGLVMLARVLLVNHASLREVLGHHPDAHLLALAFGLGLSGLVMTFLRWWVMVRTQRLPLRFRDAVRVGFVGNALDQVVPGQVGSDVVKAAFLCRTQERRTRAVASIVIDRVVGILGLFVLAGVMGGANWQDSAPAVRRLIVVVWGVLLAGLLGLAALLTPALLRQLERLAVWTGRARLRSLAGELHAASQAYRDHKFGVLLGLSMSTMSHTLYALAFTATSFALLSHPPGVAQHLQMVPLVLFSTVVPLPFGALGLSEQVSDELFRMLGHPSGALTMLAFRLVGLSVGCVSAIVYMTNGKELAATGPRPGNATAPVQAPPPAHTAVTP
jgi:uncharacterized protein (TIRG00374 family)